MGSGKKSVESPDKTSYSAIFDAANDAILVHDIETGRILDVNKKACEMYLYSREEMLKNNIGDVSQGEAPYNNKAALERIHKAANGEPQLFEWMAKDKAGRLFWVEVNLKRAVINGKYRLLAIVRDITERKETEEALQFARFSIDKAADSIFWVSRDGHILYVNEMACHVLGYSREELLAKKIGDLDPKLSGKAWSEHFNDVKRLKTMTFESQSHKKDGSTFAVEISANYLKFSGGEYVCASVRDITDKKVSAEKLKVLNKQLVKSNKELSQLALKDVQTGLYNHRYLAEVLDREFYRARRYAHTLSLVMIDVDYFRSINDVYGHQFGDFVLKQFATNLKKMVRRYDIVIRFGGEEFVVLSPGMNRQKALDAAQRIFESMNLYNFGDKYHTVKLRFSISVVSYPDDHVERPEDMMSLTEKIMTKVKNVGGNRVYSSADIETERMGSELEPSDVKVLKEKLEKLTKQGNQNVIESIFALAKTIEIKDHYTGEHVESTVYYATEIAKMLALHSDDIDHIRQAAVLHDLGKIGISDKILRKKSKLTKKEFDQIKKHPQIAADIMRPIQFLHNIIPLVLYHHERWDGKGYPAGLRAEEIPIGARIISIADVYQALTSKRPYRNAYPEKEAIKIIKEGSGTQFDPRIVKTFLKVLKKNHKGK